MKSILMTSSAAALVALSAGAAQAACPEDIDAFTREYEEAMATGTTGEALSASEQAELFGLRTTAENLYRAGNLEMCERAIERAELMLDTAIAPTALQPGQLVGMDVRNAADEYLGEVEDITIDPLSGRIAYVLVEHGGFLGIGDNLFAVPWRSVTWSPGADSLLLDITEERLEQGPRFVEDEPTAQERRAWLLSVHSYYGVDPYWQDNMASMAMAGSGGGQGVTAQPGAGQGVTVQPGAAEAVLAVPVEVESVTVTEGAEEAAEDAQTAQGDAAAVVPPSEATLPAGAPAAGDTPVLVGEQATDPGGEAVSMLMQRIEGLENQIEELSEQGIGDEVRQSILDLQEQVRQLAESGPGEEVRRAVAELRDQVQALADQRPGEEVRAALSQLETRVQQLAESAPGQEVQQAISELETRVRQLAQSEPGTELRAMLARMEAEIRELAGQRSPAGGAVLGVTQGAGGTPEVVVAPRAAQQGTPSGIGTDAALGQSGIGGTAGGGALPAAEQPAGMVATPGEAQAPDSGFREVQEQQRPDGTTVYSTVIAPQSRDQVGSVTGGGDGQAALAQPDANSEPCEIGITRLEEDLARAEQQGLSIREARSELEAAQAMLRRASEALCRAAVKRAREELVAQGFEPTQAN